MRPFAAAVTLVALVALVAVLPTHAAAGGPELKLGKAKVFVGPEGEEVAIVSVEKDGAALALVRFRGVEGEFEGMARVHEARDLGPRGTDWAFSRDGKDYVSITARAGYGGAKSYEIYPPGKRDGVKVKYDEKKSNDLSVPEVLAAYRKQQYGIEAVPKGEGDEKARHQGQDEALAAIAKAASNACGVPLAASIDWASFKGNDASPTLFGGCGAALVAASRVCADSDGKAAVKTQLKKVACKLGGKGKRGASLKSGTLEWAVDPDAANDADFGVDFLMKNLH